MVSPDPHPSSQSQDLPIRVASNETDDGPPQPVESPEAETQGTGTDGQPELAKCDRSQKSAVENADEGKGEDEGEQKQKQEDNTTTIDWVQPAEKKKKKRSKKPKSKRGKASISSFMNCPLLADGWQNKPTGFEEYYVDAPITPEQYKEEREVYDPYVHTHVIHPYAVARNQLT